MANGAVYVASRGFVVKNRSVLTGETVGYVMPEERSLDVDTEWDFRLAELLLSSRA